MIDVNNNNNYKLEGSPFDSLFAENPIMEFVFQIIIIIVL